MKPEARELDQLVKDWCVGSSRDQTLLARISDRALTGEPTSLVQFARASYVLETQNHPPRILERINELKLRLRTLQAREFQVDDLGNLDNEPQALFDILGDDVAALQGFDLGRLQQVRLSGSNRADSARLLLDALGWERLPAETASMLRAAIDDCEDREQYAAWGLFVDRSAAEGWALGIQLVARNSGAQILWSEADQEVREQARIALQALVEGWEAKIEWPANYVGESIGLPLYVAGLVVRNVIPRHSFTASTGRVEIDGRVTGVSGIARKIEAARRIGIRRVLVPRENFEEAKGAAGTALIIVPIANVSDVAGAFQQPISSVELGYSGLVRLVRASVPDFGLAITKEVKEASGYRFIVANTQGKAGIWVYTNGNVRSDGPAGTTRELADRLIKERMPAGPEPRETLRFELPTRQLQDRYRTALEELGAVEESPQAHQAWRMQISRGRSRVTVILYSSGACIIQGTAPAWDAARGAAEPIVQNIGGMPANRATKATAIGRATSEENSEPHIGTDEAGKGDYFGPLVCAAVFVDRESAATLRQLGVRDSKTLSDRRIRELAEQIRRMPEVRHAVTAINPRKFNELYERFRHEGKNLNSLLAWGHARSIDTLLNAPGSKRVNAKYVLVDQFADKHYIEERTRRAGIPVHQRPKAEEDIAVAAASVLAREGFVRWLDRWSERTQILLPKGASPQVIEAAKQFVRKWGAKWLGEVAKLNFRTTAQVLEGEEKGAGHGAPQWISEQSEPKSEG
jgi:ribonuclease HIII